MVSAPCRYSKATFIHVFNLSEPPPTRQNYQPTIYEFWALAFLLLRRLVTAIWDGGFGNWIRCIWDLFGSVVLASLHLRLQLLYSTNRYYGGMVPLLGFTALLLKK
jgi:hypothetical protein